MKAGAIIELVTAVLAALPALIQGAEALRTGQGGPQKKLFVLDAIRQSLHLAAAADPKVAKVLTPELQQGIEDASSTAIDSAVAVMNADKPAA